MSVNQNPYYPTRPEASQPELRLDQCGFDIRQDRVVVNVGQIANLRSLGDLSGTLAVELWALESPYRGGQPQGQLLAATTIGEIAGQHFIADCRYDLIFREPPAGTWHISLVLREWSADGYLSRDYVNFAVPYTVATDSSVKRGDGDNLISVDFSASKKPSKKSAATAALSEQEPASAEKACVSLNRADLNELEQVKGVSKKLAKNIVATRPFSTLDDVLKVKGMGAKLLQKIRNYITL